MRQRSFRFLWLGQSTSYFGTQITVVAFPLTAVLLLEAGPVEMGMLTALSRLPYLVLGFVAGVVVDRGSRRRLLVATNAGLAAVLAVVPVAHAMGWLSLGLLYVVAAATGSLTVFFDIAYLAFVAEVVPRHQLTEAQSLVEVTQSLAQLGGPALAGWLIAATSPPTAISIDAATYLVGALTVVLVSTIDLPTRPSPTPGSARDLVRDGLRAVFAQPVLRPVTLANATFVFWFSGFSALLVLFLVDDIGASPGEIGAVVAFGAAGGVLGAMMARRIGSWIGVGPCMAAALVTAGLAAGLTPIAAALDPSPGLAAVAGLQAVAWFGLQVFNVQQVPLRYLLTPHELHGRVNASIRTVTWGAAPVGALVGGFAGAHLGLAAALAVTGFGSTMAVGWLVTSPAGKLGSPDPAVT